MNALVSDILTGDGFLTVCTEKKSLEHFDRGAENEKEAELIQLILPQKSETVMTHKLKTSTTYRPVLKNIKEEFKVKKKKDVWFLMFYLQVKGAVLTPFTFHSHLYSFVLVNGGTFWSELLLYRDTSTQNDNSVII